MYYDASSRAGSTEQLNYDENRSRSMLKGVRSHVAIIILGLIVIIGFTSMNIYLLTRTGGMDKQTQEKSVVRHTEPETSLRIVNLEEKMNVTDLPLLSFPIDTIVIAHTNSPNCSTEDECSRQVEFLRSLYVESKQKVAIPFNFLIGGDGRAYEISGWKYQADLNKGYNNHTVYLSFIGNFDKIIPSLRQLSVAKLLIKEGLTKHYFEEDKYKLFGQCQFTGSISSPGAMLYQVIQQWPNWSKDI